MLPASNFVGVGDASLYLGDCIEVMRALPSNSIDAVVTDPPYGLSFMGKRWDYDVPAVDVWTECLRVLKPGGHLLAFAGARTQHRMAVRIEDAGFEIRDMLAWLYGSGFPKSHNVSKAIDSNAGAVREVVGFDPTCRLGANKNLNDDGWSKIGQQGAAITAPATDAAKTWDGWGTALKPALEPITMARKPLDGSVATNVQTYGTGALNINACRIAHSEALRTGSGASWDAMHAHEGREKTAGGESNATNFQTQAVELSALGRWPANVIHDGSDDVIKHFPDDAGGGTPSLGKSESTLHAFGEYAARSLVGHNDFGSAARFFYCAKTSKADRNEGLELFAKRAFGMSDCAAAAAAKNESYSKDGGRSGVNAVTLRQNHHPTVKPTELMRYLLRLVTPRGGVALDPFMGSGSTGKAALLEHFRFIGIEREPEYFEIAKARIEYIRANGVQVDLFGEAA